MKRTRCSLDVGRVLLNAAQEAGRKHPFLLVLAGTPNLEGRLNAMGVSFWDRAHQLRDRPTREMWRRPRRSDAPSRPKGSGCPETCSPRWPEKVSVIPTSCSFWATRSGAAPFPIRLDRREVTHSALERRPQADFETDAGRVLCPPSSRNSPPDDSSRSAAPSRRRFTSGRAVLNRTELERRHRRRVRHSRPRPRTRWADALETLRDLGYVWRVEARPEWEPGIPSLLDYIREHAAIP